MTTVTQFKKGDLVYYTSHNSEKIQGIVSRVTPLDSDMWGKAKFMVYANWGLGKGIGWMPDNEVLLEEPADPYADDPESWI